LDISLLNSRFSQVWEILYTLRNVCWSSLFGGGSGYLFRYF
jgi:hypothetical protein